MESNGLNFEIEVRPNDFIIIPPNLFHTAEQGVATSDRILFAGDVILTHTEYYTSDFLTPMEKWIELDNE